MERAKRVAKHASVAIALCFVHPHTLLVITGYCADVLTVIEHLAKWL